MLTQADIRHHLVNMVAEGLLTVTGFNRSGHRGRPARQYALTAIATKDNFDILASALLSTCYADLSPPGRVSFLRRVAAVLAGELAPSGPLTKRLIHVTGKFNELGYKSRWEAHIDAPRVILERCPFSPLLSQHPELCQLDGYLLETLLGEQVSQLATRTDEQHCIYLVGKN
jgi:predicted ArsR family transcriptional regulator